MIIQPFERYRPFYTAAFIRLGKTFLVSQTYKRHINMQNEGKRTGILISDYDDIGLAKGHFMALKNARDKYAAIIDLTNEKHLATFKNMLSPNSAYALYWAAVRNKNLLKKQVDFKYKDNVRRYLGAHTRWAIDRDSAVNPKLQVIFGELFVIMRYKSEELKIKFEEIEKA